MAIAERPVLGLVRSGRHASIEGGLDRLKVRFELFSSYAGFIDRVIEIAVETRARLLLVDYELLPARHRTVTRLALASPGVPVLVVAPTPSMAFAARAVKAGALDVVCPPVTISQLESAIFPERAQAPKARPAKLHEVGEQYALWMLDRNRGNVAKTARDLGIDRRTLQRKLRDLEA